MSSKKFKPMKGRSVYSEENSRGNLREVLEVWHSRGRATLVDDGGNVVCQFSISSNFPYYRSKKDDARARYGACLLQDYACDGNSEYRALVA